MRVGPLPRSNIRSISGFLPPLPDARFVPLGFADHPTMIRLAMAVAGRRSSRRNQKRATAAAVHGRSFFAGWYMTLVLLRLTSAGLSRCGVSGGVVAAAAAAAAARMSSSLSAANHRGFQQSGPGNNAIAVAVKDLWILRHGQAVHNPRAEAAREKGCSHDEFLELMRQDDCLDAPLTELGLQQAKAVAKQLAVLQQNRQQRNTRPWIVVSSPLSRALQTADLALGQCSSRSSVDDDDDDFETPFSTSMPLSKICYEGFREINGWLLNAQRQPKATLAAQFPTWNFDAISTEMDELWDPHTLEERNLCGHRGTQGLIWLATSLPTTTNTKTLSAISGTTCNGSTSPQQKLQHSGVETGVEREEEDDASILLVTHGAILHCTLSNQPHVELRDGRRRHAKHLDTNNTQTSVALHSPGDEPAQSSARPVGERFQNCELRRYRMEYHTFQPTPNSTTAMMTPETTYSTTTTTTPEFLIVLTEIDLDH